MLPTIHPGDFELCNWASFGDVKEGDICVYWVRGCRNPVSHRAVRRLRAGWLMQGDNNPCPDPAPMTAANYICKARKIITRPVAVLDVASYAN